MTISPLGARPGTKLEFVGESRPRVAPSFSDIVAIPIVHDWGPLNSAVLVTSPEEFARVYGDSDTPGRTAVIGAFQGQGIDGAPGAGGVEVYRMGLTSGGSAAAKATVQIQNTAGSPANALRLTARHQGDRGERISVVIADDPVDSARDILSIRFDGVVQERYYYANADIDGLEAQINANTGSLVVADSLVNGTALAATAGTSLAGGADGTPVTSTQWLAALGALQQKDFSIFAPYDLTDSGIQASVLSWVRAMEDASKPVIAVVGGGSSDSLATAISRSGALADPHVVNVGMGIYHDDLLDQDVTTSQLAPRLAGVLAARGENGSLTFAKLGGLSIVSGAPEDDEIVSAIENGVTVLSLASSPEADLKVERGVTTFTSQTDAVHPYDIFSDPRLIRINDIFVRNMKAFGDNKVIGNGVVNDNTRALVRGEGRRLLDELEDGGLSKAGSGYINVDPPTDPGLADAIPFEFGFSPARTANYLRGRGRVL